MKEKDSNYEKKRRMFCHRYFQMFIEVGLTGSMVNLKSIHPKSLIDILNNSKFVPQSILEDTLYSLIIKDLNRVISLDDFDRQLERDSQGLPYWKIYLKTSALITSRCIAKSISKELFMTTSSIGPRIHIHPLHRFQPCDRGKLFSIPSSRFSPGFCNWVTIKHLELLQTDQVKEAIAETPDKYYLILDGDHRLIKNKQTNSVT